MPQGAVPPPREQDIVTGPGKRLLFFLPPLAAFRPQGQDLLSGLAITGLLLPQALAYSSIGDMPAQAGIIALLAGLFCYGILGGSRFALVSPTSSSAVVLAAATASLAGNSPSGRLVVAGALVLAISLVFVLSAIIRIGNITDFIDRPVLRGFTFGLCIFIVIKQMDTVLGVQSTSQSLIYFIVDIVSQAAQWHLPSILLSAASLACLLILGRLKRLPSSTLVIILGVLASYFLDLSSYGVPLVGQISMTSAVPTIPVLGWKEWADILKLAVGITFILYAESYGAIGSFAMKHGDTLSPNRDLFALGVCNFLSGLFQGMPVGAGYSATAANETYGAQTRMSGIISLLITVVILLTALPFIAWIPRPVLASIVIYIMLSTLRLSF
ncbi:MAG: hypothetical protein LBK01_02875, partial [Burkholderiaceae bacterium]|nr:hypothetical protein [Burkholderiaceae bacterium]